MSLDVVYLDNHLLVVNKPAGLLAQQDATGDADLMGLARAFIKDTCRKPGQVYLGLVHRLDRPVSGLMVIARTSKAAARLSAQFRTSVVQKKYLALVEGAAPAQGTCINYLIKEKQKVRIVGASHPGGRYAELDWKAAGRRGQVSLLDITLKTGRPHQIRIQLSQKGLFILGDRRYGATGEFDGMNLALHCYMLGVEHPTRHEYMQWMSPPPPSWGGWFEREIASVLDAHKEN